jgi:hypothetical protein
MIIMDVHIAAVASCAFHMRPCLCMILCSLNEALDEDGSGR